MTVKEFEERFPILKPSKNTVYTYCKKRFSKVNPTGWEQNVEEILNYFSIHKIKNICTQTDELLKLADCYNSKGIYNLTNITLFFEDLETQRPELKCFLVGNFESTQEIIKIKNTGQVAYYTWDEGEIVYYVAENSEKFLDALFEMCDIEDKLKIDSMKLMYIWNEEKAKVCSQLAGGEQYLEFYRKYFNDEAPYGLV